MTLDEIKKLDQEYFLPVFGERMPVCFTHGEGVYLYDLDGKKYTDFLSGIAVNALGYADEGFKKVLKKQVDQLLHVSNYFYIEPQAKLARTLCKRTGYSKVFFGNSGAEANECAIKIAKKYAFDKGSKSAKFVSLNGSFHGRTVATLTATGQEKFHTPFEPGTFSYQYVEPADIEAVKAAVDAETCGVLLEVIQGEGGVFPLEIEYVREVRRLCDEQDVLLIIDEVQTGMGRTGKFLAQEWYGVKADIVTLAKALGGGVPIGACLVNEKAAAAFGPGDHGSTFGGNYLACAAGQYMVDAVDDTMLGKISRTGEYFMRKLKDLQQKYPGAITDVRGKGLLLAAQLSNGYDPMLFKKRLLDKGFVIATAGRNCLRFLPPYLIEEKHVDALIGALDGLLAG